MTKRILCLAMVGLFLSCNRGAKKEETAPAANPYEINCEGIGAVKLTSTHADLTQQFGSDLMDSVYHVGGIDHKASYIHHGDSEEIIVQWAETEAPYNTIKKLIVIAPNSAYSLANGIRVGSTMDEVRTANNFMPVSMTSFYAAVDGYAHSLGFNGGDLEVNYPCLGLSFDITKQYGVDVKMVDELKTMGEVKSSHAIFGFLDVQVVGIQVNGK
jgi:hypothetical protein